MFDIMEIVMKYRSIINKQYTDKFEELVHELVASELSNGEIKNGLLLKASIEANGNQDKAKIIYAKNRIEQLKKEIINAATKYDEMLSQSNKAAEEKRLKAIKLAEEERLKEIKLAEEKKRASIDKFNAEHKICEYCSCITDKNNLVCPRCHLPL
jgi:hypothetical protein